MIMSCDKKKQQIITSYIDFVILLSIEIDNQLKFEKHASTITSFYMFLSRQYSLLYIYLYIENVFKYLLILSEIKESNLYYFHIKVVRFSSDLLPRSSSLPITCCKVILQILA